MSVEFGRGLSEGEVALVKALTSKGTPRDIIMSYLAVPGRKLSPACVGEIRAGKIGQSVDPLSDAEADSFMRELVRRRPH